MPASSTCVEPLDGLGEGRQVGRQHALAQVAQVDHGDHAVALARRAGGALEGEHRLELALQRDVDEAHGFGGQGRRGRAQQPDRGLDAGGAQARGVLEPRLAERLGAAGQHRAPDLGRAAGHLGDPDHVAAAQARRPPGGCCR